jgi:N-acetylglucosaminyldiphosphoundecaprenol N-acetyl-beta-D-mannosaminyltransferase
MKKSLISINIDTGTYKNFVNEVMDMSARESSYTCIANVHMLVEAYGNASFARIVNDADIITPDGVPLTWGLKLLHGIKQDRVAGMDLLPDILKEAEKKSIPVYFYGGTEDMLLQELWMGTMKNRIRGTMIGVGGALPVLLGIQRRAPLWMQRNGFEWLFRLYQEPCKEIIRIKIFRQKGASFIFRKLGGK